MKLPIFITFIFAALFIYGFVVKFPSNKKIDLHFDITTISKNQNSSYNVCYQLNEQDIVCRDIKQNNISFRKNTDEKKYLLAEGCKNSNSSRTCDNIFIYLPETTLKNLFVE